MGWRRCQWQLQQQRPLQEGNHLTVLQYTALSSVPAADSAGRVRKLPGRRPAGGRHPAAGLEDLGEPAGGAAQGEQGQGQPAGDRVA